MGKENKSYRIRTNVNQDKVVNFSIDNTVESLEILSLTINQENSYRLMGSNTGIVVGRVLANGGFGVPNVKVSVFVPYEETDNVEQRVLYAYTGTTDRNYDGVRYNLLPDKVDDECHQNIGTFPSKRVLLDNNNWIDVFDKYYKFTTRTNEAGDYMIYGVPTGNQTIHMDADMSDIGVLSQKPRDMIYNGYNGNMFESPTKFKVDTNIDSLAQVRTQDQAVYVYPFWGDTTDSSLNASITRCDMNINYKFEPTCIFMGSIITDTGENAMTEECVAAENQGKMSDMITGEGKIEMIRKTPNGQIEQFSVNGDNNINGDGVWCYQIPMNLDYVMHDEFGKMVMTDNPNIGIPTRARVRFRLSMAESPSDAIAKKRARFLIPNNPHLIEEDYPNYCETKEIDYEFGTKTKDENFRDLFWNNVYTVKSYIPRLQESKSANSLKHLGIKCVNHPGGHNPMPFNNLRIKFNFVYMFLCTLIKVLVTFVGAINALLTFIGWLIWKIGTFFFDAAKAVNVDIVGIRPFNWLAKIFAEYNGHGVRDNDGISVEDYLAKVWSDMQNNTDVCSGISAWFMRIFLGIGCGITLNGLCETDSGESLNVSPGTNDNVKNLLKEKGIMTCDDNVSALFNCIENQLAQDNEVTRFNFCNDWINGVVYLPLWHREITKKRSYLFGLITVDASDEWCSTDNTINKTRAYKKDLLFYNTNIPQRKVSKGTTKTMGTISPLVNNEDTAIAYANDETGYEVLKFFKENDENCYGYQCHKFARTYFKIYKGLVYEKETMLGDKVYYYRPCDYDPSTGNSDLVTLFATDLVLLGSLNDCDIHGIPQFFKTLESTTYNMPPDLLSEHYDYINSNEAVTDDQLTQQIDLGSRATEYTGADWGNLGVDQSNYTESVTSLVGNTYYSNANENQYDNGGLFYGLTCFDSYTKPKSCINLSRICELGISLDGSHMLPSKEDNGTDNNVEALTPDGFVSYDEIYNPDYRSMFATLNGNFLKTKLNPETGLLEYDFNHTYIDNFDGSLKLLMKAKTVNGYTEKSNFERKANYINNHNLELSSDAYLSFRYGNYVKKNGNKIYFYDNVNQVGRSGSWYEPGKPIDGKNRQPRYENSFYFYFGLNEGKTAIDKFNTEFFSDCTNNFASEVPYDLTYQGNSWCPINARDGFIAFNMNIEPPYSIKFTNRDTNDVYSQDNINSEKFIFCDPTIPGNPPDGYSKYALYTLEVNNNPGDVCYIIPNGTYTIELIDGYDNVYTDNLTFESTRIGFVCDVNPFSCKNAELLSKFSDNEFKTIAQTYTNIANYAKFVDDSMAIDMDALRYSLYEPGYVIKNGDIYYKKVLNVFTQTVATSDITVPNPNSEYYYYHEPKLDRDIRGFVALSDVTEDNFRIDFQPIDTDFFGSNYIGTSVSVHITYELYTEFIIPFGETYYVLDNGKYEPRVAQDDIRNDGYYKAIVSVTENKPSVPYVKYKVGTTIPNGSKYYDNTYTEQTADRDIIVPDPNDDYYYKVDSCGYLGYILYDGVITHYFGVPYGGKRYKITTTQLCECDHDLDPGTPEVWCDTDNVTIINVIVYEDEFKMYINGIDYDLIQKFKTGWSDDKLVGSEFRDDDNNPSEFNDDNVYGWNDILNSGYYRYNGSNKKLSQIEYMRTGTSSTDHTDLNEVIAICEVLNSNYTENATGEDNGETPYNWYGDYCYDAPSNTPNDYYKGVVDKRTYSYAIAPGVTLYDGDGNEVIVLVANGPYKKSDSTQATLNVDYTITDVYTYTIKSGTRLYDGNGDRVTADQIQHGGIYYLDSPQTVVATLGVDYFESFEIAEGVTLYDYSGNVVTAEDIQEGVTYYKDDTHTTLAVLGDDYFYVYTIADGVTLYDSDGNKVTADHIVHGDTYYLDSPQTIIAVLDTDYFETHTYAYQIINDLYDVDGNLINVVVHGNTYYIDDTHTVEAEIGVDYTEVATEEQINVTRYDYKMPYLDYVDNDYLYDGNTYRYENPFSLGNYKYGVVNGYPNGIKVSMFRRTLRIRDGITLYGINGNIVTSSEIIPDVVYYLDSVGETEAVRGRDYILYSPTISYELETPMYRAEFKEGNDNPNGDILVNEDNDGVLTYKVEDNVEYNDLDCLTFYDYRNIIDSINTVIENRNEFVRNVGGIFRINEDETTLILTTKTKAKPVKYLIAGNSEITVFDKLYNYRPTNNLRQRIDNNFSIVTFNELSDINNTSYASVTSVKNVSDGYVVDKNLETQTIGFSLATLTYDYDFVEYQDNETIYNGDVYYSEEVVAYPLNTVLEIGTECYEYHDEYYDWVTLNDQVTIDRDNYGYYFYTTKEKIKNTAIIRNELGILSITQSNETQSQGKVVSEFVKYAHTTERIYKVSSGTKQYLPYYINKHKHPYYVSVMNDNDSIIPPGKDLTNFTDLGGNKNLKSTFGVHFYNKPLKSDFKMIFSFLNNIPAYPLYSLGGNVFFAPAYTMTSFKYYNYEYPNDDTVTIPEDTVVYGFNNTITESDEIVLLQEYYQYTVGKQVGYVKYRVGAIIPNGTVYYIYNETTDEYTPTTATSDLIVLTGDEYYYVGVIYNQYNSGDTIYEGQTYYTRDGFNDTYVRHIAESTFIVSGSLITGYYYAGEKTGAVKTKIATMMGIPSQSNNVGLRGHNFILCNDTTDYDVYNGDIIYYNEYTPYPNGSTIEQNESYYERSDDGVFTLWVAIEQIHVPSPNSQYFYVDESPCLKRRIAVLQNNNSQQINEYIQNLKHERGFDNLRDVFYPYKDTVDRGGRSNVQINTSKVNMYISINRYGYNYNNGTDELGNYCYSLSDDCCKDDLVTNRKWKARFNDNGIVSYNNIGVYRYCLPQLTRINLTKRDEASPLEPLYESNGVGHYSVVSNYDYIAYQDNTRIGVGKSYYKGTYTYELLGGLTCLYSSGRIALPVMPSEMKHGVIYYVDISQTMVAQEDVHFSETLTYEKITVNDNSDVVVVPVGNEDSTSEYYMTYCHGTPILSDINYYGLYMYGTQSTSYVYYNTDNVISSADVTSDWEPVDVFMPGFLSGYVYNGIPRSDDDKTNIKAQLNETEINLYTPNTSDNPDVYENINVRRLIYTPNSEYNSDNPDSPDYYPATYGTYNALEPTSGLNYQYIEVPLVDEEFIYTDGYGDDYRKTIFGTLSVVFDNPLLTYFNLGRTEEYVKKHLDYEDYIKTKTFYTNDDGYVKHQTLYYIFDLDKTEYPLYYYNSGDSALDSNLKYDIEQDRFYFSKMPELLVDIDNSNYISKSKSTDFSVWSYIRKKYGQVDNGDKVAVLPLEVERPKDKFFAIACVDGYYAISPVIETQMFRVILNYNGFDNRNGSPIYITARDSRDRSSITAMKGNIHYIEDMYYMLYYRFVIHVSNFDYDEDNENARYNSDVYTQVCSVSEGTAEHCYIRVDSKDDDITYWASAIKVNLSSLGANAMDGGKINDWLQIVIEDASGGLRVSAKETSGDNPEKGVDITEFDTLENMMEDYNNNSGLNIPSNEIWYRTTDNTVTTPNSVVYILTSYNDDIDTQPFQNSVEVHVDWGNIEIESNTYEDGLGKIKFTGDITKVPMGAFLKNNKLVDIKLPSSDVFESVNNDAFRECSNLKSVNIGSAKYIGTPNENFRNLPIDAMYRTDYTTLYQNISWDESWPIEYTMEVNGTTISRYGANVFRDCNRLEDITMNKVWVIGANSFENCTSLKEIKLPETLWCICGACDNYVEDAGVFYNTGLKYDTQDNPLFIPKTLTGDNGSIAETITGISGLKSHFGRYAFFNTPDLKCVKFESKYPTNYSMDEHPTDYNTYGTYGTKFLGNYNQYENIMVPHVNDFGYRATINRYIAVVDPNYKDGNGNQYINGRPFTGYYNNHTYVWSEY